MGHTYSADGIATSGTYQSTVSTGRDLFAAKFTAAGVRLWGTYYGGTGLETSGSICVSGTSVYIVGNTVSTGLSSTGAHQQTVAGSNDGILVKLDGANGARTWATYYGGAGSDNISALAVDAAGNVYIGGSTPSTSTTGIATTGALQTAPSGTGDAFVAKFNTNGVRQWGSYIGGPGTTDVVFGIAVDATGNVYLSGHTNSTAGIAAGGATDMFLMKLNSSGTTKLWGTYWGGDGGDLNRGLLIGPDGNLVTAGFTGTAAAVGISNGLASAGAYQTTPSGERDLAFSKFTPDENITISPCGPGGGCPVLAIKMLTPQGCPKVFGEQEVQLFVSGINAADYNFSWTPANIMDNASASTVNITTAAATTVNVTVANKYTGQTCTAPPLSINNPAWSKPMSREVPIGQSVPWTITLNSQGPVNGVQWGMWIDWNADGTFDNFYNGSANTASPTPVTVNVTAPSNASTGFVVRLGVKGPGTAFTAADYNTTIANGEWEDYIRTSPLPVDLLYFNAMTTGCNSEVSWATGSEHNSSHFEVELSSDGMNWKTMTTIEAAGFSGVEQTYGATISLLKGVNNYLRLKIVNKDGAVEYSMIRVLRCDGQQPILVWPNPAKTQVQLSGLPEGSRIQMVDATGRLGFDKGAARGYYGNPQTAVASHQIPL
ncbi:hypothetical protein OSTOST_10372 [Ostertagia ostertagi]